MGGKNTLLSIHLLHLQSHAIVVTAETTVKELLFLSSNGFPLFIKKSTRPPKIMSTLIMTGQNSLRRRPDERIFLHVSGGKLCKLEAKAFFALGVKWPLAIYLLFQTVVPGL